ncbi:centromere/kinetochore protein zw10 homolog [Cimex lectularius]|uniref:Centromere/kinetochore protein zw10 n=1 Tax=Cimex lectularius TaxID=79782 RepID=A0A8I6R5T7_CIMLE|nr:centromere/kinetochore protein zw10 homolog [Cimex lectularius]
MSFLNEILQCASEMEVNEIKDKIMMVEKNLTILKSNVKTHMEKKHIEIMRVGDPSHLIELASEISSNINELQKRLNNDTKTELSNLSEEMKELVNSLKESSISVDIIKTLFDLDVHVGAMKAQGDSINHFEVAKHHKAALDLLTKYDYCEYINIMEKMKNSMMFRFMSISDTTVDCWNKSVCWNYCDIGEGVKTCTLTVNGTVDNIASLMGALHLYGKSGYLIYTFSQNLLEKVINPCIDSKTNVKSSATRNEKKLSITSETDQKSHFQQVLTNLKMVFLFIQDTLDFEIKQLDCDEISESKNKSQLFIRQVGSHIENEVLTILVEECLTNAIPLKKPDLQEYEKQVQDIVDFQSLLLEIGFLCEKSALLEKYCGNVNEQFRNKTIERYLSRARQIYKKPLQDKVQVKMQLNKENKTTAGESLIKLDTSEIQNSLKMNKLCPNMLQFPDCYISISTVELVDLGKEIILNSFSTPDFDPEMFTTARDIFSLYHEAVPKIHGKYLDNLAEQSALFYNNCWYLAHKLITINEEFRSSIPHNTRPPLACFVDLAHPLITKGIHILDQQINKQFNQISSILEQSGLSSLSDSEVLTPMTGKCMKQCMHLLSYLQSVWQDVLPTSVYCQVLGSLTSNFLNEIIDKIVVTSDIRADIATSLVQVFSSVTENIPKLFPEPQDVIIYVKTWTRFNELVFILGANLINIGERWADSKGPIAAVFSASEVQQLIRALFQVSNRRAALLARIK